MDCRIILGAVGCFVIALSASVKSLSATTDGIDVAVVWCSSSGCGSSADSSSFAWDLVLEAD